MVFLFIIVFKFWLSSFMAAGYHKLAPCHIWTVRHPKDGSQVHGAHARRAPPGTMDQILQSLPLIAACSARCSLSLLGQKHWKGCILTTVALDLFRECRTEHHKSWTDISRSFQVGREKFKKKIPQHLEKAEGEWLCRSQQEKLQHKSS